MSSFDGIYEIIDTSDEYIDDLWYLVSSPNPITKRFISYSSAIILLIIVYIF